MRSTPFVTFIAILILCLELPGPAGMDLARGAPRDEAQLSSEHVVATPTDDLSGTNDGTAIIHASNAGDRNAGRRSPPVWTFAANAVTMSSPKFADVDGDLVQEIIQATMGPIGNPYSEGRVYIFRRDGTLLPGWPVVVGAPITSSCPAVADLDGDGDIEIVAQSWAYTYVWNQDGSDAPGWPRFHGTGTSGSAALADLDGDDDLEIVCPTGASMNVWHHDGTVFPGWPKGAPKYLSPPSVADVDGDGELEIAAGTWEGPYPGQGPFPFYLWETDGTPASGFPLPDAGGQTRGAISVGDLEGDGSVEIVARINDCIRVWNSQGQILPGWPVCPDAIRNASTAIGDIDGDGDFEISIAGFQAQAFHHDGSSLSGWPVVIPPGTANVNSGVVIAELDGEPTQREVVVHSRDTFTAIRADGTLVSGFPYTLSDDGQAGTFSAAPAVGDLNRDGQLEYLFVSASGRVAFFDEPRGYPGDLASWPVMQHDSWNTGLLSRTDPTHAETGSDPTGGRSLSLPNPFRAGSSFRLSGRIDEAVTILVVDPNGRLLRHWTVGPSQGETIEVSWDGRANDGAPLGTGIYFLTAQTREWQETRRVLLLP